MGKKPTRKNRYKKNRKAMRRRWFKRLAGGAKLMGVVGLVIAISALFMAGYAAVTRSDYFRTKAIEIHGYERLLREDVLGQAQIRTGENLLAINLGLVRKRLLAHPWIASARVTREIPERIQINIKEHTPLAVVDLGRKFLLNSQGRIFKEYQKTDPKDLPLITGVVYADISLGNDDLTPPMAAVVKVLHLSGAADSVIPLNEIKRLHYDQEIGLSIRLGQNQRTLKMGPAPYATKYKRLKQLLPQIRHNRKWRKFESVDVNNPDRIVVKLVTSSNKGA